VLSTNAVREWQIRRVALAAGNPVRERAAKISVNSLLRQSRSLFSPRLVRFLDPKIVPAELPFRGVEFFPRESKRYQSRIDAAELAQCAVAKLAPEPLKVFLLAICAGLRRGEIDRLLWRQVDLDRGEIRVEVTEAGALKTSDSAGSVPVDERFVTLLRGYRARANGPYVIEAGTGETASAPWGRRYRCRRVLAQLNEWLRSRGVTARRAIHELRREAGSIVATQSGIHAASKFLRHAGIAVTAQHYADHKERIVVPLGALLAPDNVADMRRLEKGTVPKASLRARTAT
jgi:integrase